MRFAELISEAIFDFRIYGGWLNPETDVYLPVPHQNHYDVIFDYFQKTGLPEPLQKYVDAENEADIDPDEVPGSMSAEVYAFKTGWVRLVHRKNELVFDACKNTYQKYGSIIFKNAIENSQISDADTIIIGINEDWSSKLFDMRTPQGKTELRKYLKGMSTTRS